MKLNTWQDGDRSVLVLVDLQVKSWWTRLIQNRFGFLMFHLNTASLHKVSPLTLASVLSFYFERKPHWTTLFTLCVCLKTIKVIQNLSVDKIFSLKDPNVKVSPSVLGLIKDIPRPLSCRLISQSTNFTFNPLKTKNSSNRNVCDWKCLNHQEEKRSGRKSTVRVIKSIKEKQTFFPIHGFIIFSSWRLKAFIHLINYL